MPPILIKFKFYALIRHMKEKTANKLRKKVVETYDDIAKHFSQTRQHGWKEFETYLKHIKDGDNIIDIGCANGRLNSYLSKHKKVNYTGIDNSEELLKQAKLTSNATFIQADMLKIPLPDESFSVACAIASFHHIPGKELKNRAMREIKRVLKKDGKLIITVWNLFQAKYKKYIWQARLKALLSFGKYDFRDTYIPWGKSKIKRYYYAFTQKEIRKLLEEHGFKILEEHTGNNYTFICKK